MTNAAPPIQALVFDFDGTIADTEWPVYEAYRAAHEFHGLELTLETWVSVVGTADNPPVDERLRRELGHEPDPEALRIADHHFDLAKQGVPLLPGVEALVDRALASGVRVALASSSPMSWIEPHMTRLGLIDRFEALSTVDQVAAGKPAPDLFNLSAQQLELDPATCLVLEDSRNGFLAAKAAGMPSVIIPNRITKLDVHPDATHVIDSLLDFPFQEFGIQ